MTSGFVKGQGPVASMAPTKSKIPSILQQRGTGTPKAARTVAGETVYEERKLGGGFGGTKSVCSRKIGGNAPETVYDNVKKVGGAPETVYDNVKKTSGAPETVYENRGGGGGGGNQGGPGMKVHVGPVPSLAAPMSTASVRPSTEPDATRALTIVSQLNDPSAPRSRPSSQQRDRKTTWYKRFIPRRFRDPKSARPKPSRRSREQRPGAQSLAPYPGRSVTFKPTNAHERPGDPNCCEKHPYVCCAIWTTIIVAIVGAIAAAVIFAVAFPATTTTATTESIVSSHSPTISIHILSGSTTVDDLNSTLSTTAVNGSAAASPATKLRLRKQARAIRSPSASTTTTPPLG